VPGRTFLLLALVLVAGCGGGGPKSDPEAVTQVLKDAAKAISNGDGDKACGYLTPDAQREAALQVGGGLLANTDCPTLVKRATAFMTPLDRRQIESLQPANVQVNGTSASATLSTQGGANETQPLSVQLNLQKTGSDWKISGFTNAQGLPGG
jgi:hypothetical protein